MGQQQAKLGMVAPQERINVGCGYLKGLTSIDNSLELSSLSVESVIFRLTRPLFRIIRVLQGNHSTISSFRHFAF